MNIHLVTTDEAIRACFPVMRELRPHLDVGGFVAQVRDMSTCGYRLAALLSGTQPVAVAGFRIAENLAWGRHLYVDDLVTAAAQRSQGHGAALLRWLREHARKHQCRQLHLDSGMQRVDAHRFYAREGMTKAGYHFVQQLE